MLEKGQALPGTTKKRVLALKQFYDFIKYEFPAKFGEAPAIQFHVAEQMLNSVLPMWTAKFNTGEAKIAMRKDYYKRSQRHAGNKSSTFKVGDVLALLRDKHFLEEQARLSKLPPDQFNEDDVTRLRRILQLKQTLGNGHRPGVCCGMMVDEYSQRVPTKDGKGYIIGVSKHKTGASTIAKLYVPNDDMDLMMKYDSIVATRRQGFRGEEVDFSRQAIQAKNDPSVPTSCLPFYTTKVGKDPKNDDMYRFYRFINNLRAKENLPELPKMTARKVRPAIATATTSLFGSDSENTRLIAMMMAHNHDTQRAHYVQRDLEDVERGVAALDATIKGKEDKFKSALKNNPFCKSDIPVGLWEKALHMLQEVWDHIESNAQLKSKVIKKEDSPPDFSDSDEIDDYIEGLRKKGGGLFHDGSKLKKKDTAHTNAEKLREKKTTKEDFVLQLLKGPVTVDSRLPKIEPETLPSGFTVKQIMDSHK